MQMNSQIVIGGGSWGMGIAAALAAANQDVGLLVRNPQTVQLLAKGKCRQLPDQPAVAALAATIDPACLRMADLIYVVVPAGATRDTLCLIKEMANPEAGIVFAAKGLVTDASSGGRLLPEIAAADLPDRQTGILSGPSFADEVLAGLPAALTIAAQTPPLIDAVQQSFANSNLRLYGNDDPIGVAVGGTMKNVIAIAAGCAIGLGLGDNAKAAILTRGVAEMARFAVAVGGRLESVYGLSGVGDLALTCAGPHSRNMAYGMAIGAGLAPDTRLAEGRYTVAAMARRAATMGLELPITNAVDRVINHGDNLHDVVTALLARPTGREG
jgi:glycerol-3-phosphate dehydrogenase (NAD(P)+)